MAKEGGQSGKTYFVYDTEESYVRPGHKFFGHIDAIQYEME